MFRRFVVLFCLIFLGFLIIKRPDGALSKGLISAAVILGLVGLRAVWGRVSARHGVRVCRIHTGGLVVTGLFGQVKHAVPWDRIAELKHMSNLSPLLTFHRFDLVRHDARPVAVLVLKANPEFVPAAAEGGGAGRSAPAAMTLPRARHSPVLRAARLRQERRVLPGTRHPRLAPDTGVTGDTRPEAAGLPGGDTDDRAVGAHDGDPRGVGTHEPAALPPLAPCPRITDPGHSNSPNASGSWIRTQAAGRGGLLRRTPAGGRCPRCPPES